MEISDFVPNAISKLWRGAPLPGNSQGETTMPQLDGTLKATGGKDNSTFSTWISNAESVITYPYTVVHNAYTEVKDKAHAAAQFVADAKTATANAATGFASWTRWVVVGIIAIAVIYVVALIPRRP